MKNIYAYILLNLLLQTFFSNAWAFSKSSDNHVRVILDTSVSMRGYKKKGIKHRAEDPGKLSILSTLLLLDLVSIDLKPGSGDSFKVITFDKNYEEWLSDTPPKSKSQWIELDKNKRVFERKIKALVRNAKRTYFSPAVLQAIKDLKKSSKKEKDLKTIVLITDGLSDAPEKDSKLLKEYANRLNDTNIKIYILAFGKDVFQSSDYFEAITETNKGLEVGEIFLLPNGKGLLEAMTKIFAQRFGFAKEFLKTISNNQQFDFQKNSKPEHVAVVTFSNSPHIPDFKLSPPSPNKHRKFHSTQQKILGEDQSNGGSYKVTWVANPSKGKYRFKSSSGVSASIAVLRPVGLQIKVGNPYQITKSFDSVLAEQLSEIPVIVRTDGGGEPGNGVSVEYLTLASKKWKDTISKVAKNRGPIKSSLGRSRGRLYMLNVTFPENYDAPNKAYSGFIEIKAIVGDKQVGKVPGKGHPIEIHPILSLVPEPSEIKIGQGPIKKGDPVKCEEFILKEVSKYFSKNIENRSIKVKLISNDQTTSQNTTTNELSLTLNDTPVNFSDTSLKFSSKQDLLNKNGKKYKLCLKIKQPTNYKSFNLNLNFTLDHPPYDRYKVIKPLKVKFEIDSGVEPNDLHWWKALILLPLFLIFWYLRFVPKLEKDLYYSIIEDGSSNDQDRQLRKFGLGNIFKLILNLTRTYDIKNSDQDIIGKLRPIKNLLYEIKINEKFKLYEVNSNNHLSGWNSIKVNTPYKITGARRNYIFRVEYE